MGHEDCRALVANRIRQAGPLTVAAYMDLALYAPGVGYYARADQRSGRAGDFYTSVDTGPLFGELLAAQFAEMWRRLQGAEPSPPARVDLVEAAAGNGRLSKDILDAARVRDPAFYAATALHLSERSAGARAAQLATLDGHAARLAWSDEGLPSHVTGILFANELLDALPVHLVTMTGDGLREIYVDLEAGALVERVGPPSTPALPAYLDEVGVVLDPGVRAEINLCARTWMRDAASRLDRGFLVLIDYGHDAADLYSARHAAGTLATFQRHQMDTRDPASSATPPWLVEPGSRDLTTHVDFTGLRLAAGQSGLALLGMADQMHFLLGIATAAGVLDDLARPARVRDRLAFKTLMVPGGLGTTHSVLVFGKGVGRPDLMGLTGLPRG